jgi:hypothetical protein
MSAQLVEHEVLLVHPYTPCEYTDDYSLSALFPGQEFEMCATELRLMVVRSPPRFGGLMWFTGTLL